MPKITHVRPILLSAPYADAEDLEVQIHLPSGYRTCGLVEITLEDGTTGLGEGYAAVFAPRVFLEIVQLIAPYLIGRESSEVTQRYREMCSVTDYWSLQGAARHVISALEIALIDANSKHLGVPAHVLLGGLGTASMRLYGSGGDATTPAAMAHEVDLLRGMGIDLFKIRARRHQSAKAAWTLEHAGNAGIAVAVDMAQNLANPAQTVGDVTRFVEEVHGRTAYRIDFLEEVLGPFDLESYPLLRAKVNARIAGGEIVTTAHELCRRVSQRIYDLAQPDATVIGGIYQTLEVAAACRQYGAEAVVHCWGGAVCMMANYHAAFAAGTRLAEWPMKQFALRDAMMTEPLHIEHGQLRAPTALGLGVKLTPEIEAQFPFREDAVYRCLAAPITTDERLWDA